MYSLPTRRYPEVPHPAVDAIPMVCPVVGFDADKICSPLVAEPLEWEAAVVPNCPRPEIVNVVPVLAEYVRISLPIVMEPDEGKPAVDVTVRVPPAAGELDVKPV